MSRSSALWRAAFEATSDALMITDPAGAIIACNGRFRRLFGVEEAATEAVALPIVLSLVVDAEQFMRRAKEILADPEADASDLVELRDGRLIERFSSPQRLEGAIVGRVWSFHDATARRRAERASLESEARFRTMYENVEIGLVELEPSGRLLSANPKATRILDRREAELLEMDLLSVTHPEDRERTAAVLRRFATREIEAQVFETRFVRRDGWIIWAQVTGASVLLQGVGVERMVLVIEDISARKRVEDALRRAELELTELIENMPIGVVIVRDGRVVYANTAFAKSLGWARPELAGVHLEALLHPDDIGLARGLLESAEVVSGDVRMVRRDRRMIMTAFLAGAEIVFHGEAARIAIARDVTEQSRVDAQLLLADRMASVGRLAAGIAHEINNPLQYILTNLEFVSSEAETLSGLGVRAPVLAEITTALEEARTGAERVRVIVRDVRTFSRADDELRTPVDVRVVLDSVLRMVDRGLRQRATMVRDFGPVPSVIGSEARLAQVFLNLVVNALEAMSEVGSTVNEVRLTTRTDASGRAVVEVRDTGPGIPPEIVERIFDPFFTTKPIGRGTGLGLSVSYGIVTAVGGTLEAESEVGRGSMFRVVLPPAPAPETKRSSEPSKPPRGRVLVIDDEPLVGVAVRRLLAPEHDVTAVTSGRDALALLAQGATFDVILCDLILPELDGPSIYLALRTSFPNAADRVVFATGGAFTPEAAAFLESTDRPTLEKPVGRDELQALLKEMLKERA